MVGVGVEAAEVGARASIGGVYFSFLVVIILYRMKLWSAHVKD